MFIGIKYEPGNYIIEFFSPSKLYECGEALIELNEENKNNNGYSENEYYQMWINDIKYEIEHSFYLTGQIWFEGKIYDNEKEMNDLLKKVFN